MARESDSGERMSYAGLINVAMQAGFNATEARIMAAIAMAESSGRVTAHNQNARTGDNSYGLWQINMIGKLGPARLKQFGITSANQLFNPLTNARAAYALYKGRGSTFRDWSTYNNGAYQRYLTGTNAPPAGKAGAAAPAGPAPVRVSGYVITGGKGYRITQNYGNKSSRYRSGVHTGMDIAVPTNTPIYSMTGGTVVKSDYNGAWGNYVLVKDANGNTYRYGHLNSRAAQTGDTVKAGQFIGKSGSTGNSTGPHLHFEIKNSAGKYVNPAAYYTKAGAYTPAASGAAAPATTTGPGNNTGYQFSQDFLDANPEVAKIFEDAIAGGWDPIRFEAALKSTSWWQKRSAAQQTYDVLTGSNPGEAARQVEAKKAEIKQRAAVLGITLTDAQINQLASEFARNQTTGVEIDMRIGQMFRQPGAGQATAGNAAAFQEEVMKTASDYGIKLSSGQLQQWTREWATSGTQLSTQAYTDKIREQSKILYKPIASQLDSMTLRDWLSPYLGIASAELGVPLGDSVNLADPKWTQPVFGADNKPMDATQWTSTVRQDPRYGWDKTYNARQSSSNLAADLSRMFGAIG